ncbi:MAG: hypothetical protein AAGA99_18850 [Actinomycetota bacterium]
MIGAIVLVVVLLVFPLLVGVGGAALSAVLGGLLPVDAEARHEGSELIESNT